MLGCVGLKMDMRSTAVIMMMKSYCGFSGVVVTIKIEHFVAVVVSAMSVKWECFQHHKYIRHVNEYLIKHISTYL